MRASAEARALPSQALGFLMGTGISSMSEQWIHGSATAELGRSKPIQKTSSANSTALRSVLSGESGSYFPLAQPCGVGLR